MYEARTSPADRGLGFIAADPGDFLGAIRPSLEPYPLGQDPRCVATPDVSKQAVPLPRREMVVDRGVVSPIAAVSFGAPAA
jgi:hypothetical protein